MTIYISCLDYAASLQCCSSDYSSKNVSREYKVQYRLSNLSVCSHGHPCRMLHQMYCVHSHDKAVEFMRYLACNLNSCCSPQMMHPPVLKGPNST